MKKSKKIGILVAVAGATVAMGGVYATSLTLTAGQAAAGSDAVADCQGANALTFTPGAPTYNAGTGTYRISTVSVTGVQAACEDSKLRVTAVGAADAALETGAVVTIGATGTEVFTLANPVNVNELQKWTAAITAA